jgi:hypothetical protein
MVTVLHPPQNYECPPFWNGWSYVKTTRSRQLQCHHLNTKCRPNPPICSKVEPTSSVNIHHIQVVEATRLKKYGIEDTFNITTSVQNSIQIQRSVQKLHPPQTFKHLQFWNDRGPLQCHHLHGMHTEKWLGKTGHWELVTPRARCTSITRKTNVD